MMTVSPLRTTNDAHGAPLPPSNVGAEQGLLGAMLINNAAYGRVAEFLVAEHFSNAVHGRIFAAIGKLVDRGHVANPVTLKSLFDQDGALAEIGGAQYLARLAESAVTIINAEHYGRAIHDLHLRRELITIGQDVVTEAFSQDLDDPATAQIERAEAKLFELATTGQADGGPRQLSIGAAIRRADAAHKGGAAGVPTGFSDIDGKLGGLRPANLIILAGRPSMGKTALATNIAFRVAAAGTPTALFSLEMSRDELEDRILAEQSKIPADRIRRGGLSGTDFDIFLEIERRLEALPLYIDDRPGLSLVALRSRARRLKRQHKLGLLIVDYLQLMRPTGGARVQNRVDEVSEITRGLKAIAKELNMPVMALSQLSRAPEQREDKRPMLSDLRESGSIEQDADVVMFIFREEYYLARRDPDALSPAEAAALEDMRGIAELIVAKNRSGPIGEIGLAFDATLTRFDNLAKR